MASYENYQEATVKITAIISNGFRLTRSELYFIESSFSISSAEDLSEMIRVDDSDIDVVCELVVSPNQQIREDFELFFCTASFCKEDAEKLIQSFCIKKLKTKIIFPGTDESVSIHLTDYLIKRFITKLNITRNPDNLLLKTTEMLPEPLRSTTLVRIRRSRMNMTKSTIGFLAELIKQRPMNEDGFFKLFDFALSVMEEASQPAEIMTLFIKKKRSHEKTLGALKTVKKQLETSAVETLMMQGTRLPPVTEDEVKAKIKLAKTILATLFGYIDTPDEKPSAINLGRISDKKDIKKVFRILS